MSTDPYKVLHYRKDLTLDIREGQIIGSDSFGRPFAVIDAEYDPSSDITTVHLQYASTEQIRSAVTA